VPPPLISTWQCISCDMTWVELPSCFATLPEACRKMIRVIPPASLPKPIVERAFELARTGRFANMAQLEKALYKEGYSRQDLSLTGVSIRKQLRSLCAMSQLFPHSTS